MNKPKIIASLITNTIDVSAEQLLEQFVANNEDIYYGPFRAFCEKQGVIVEHHEFLDLLDANSTYLFNEYSDKTGRYWVPALVEGYVSNSLPGDWDDFGDDQIEGITKPVFGDGAQQQPMEFDPLSNAQISDNPDSEQVPDDLEPESEPDPPDFDTRIRHRPSRSVRELEGGVGLNEQDVQIDENGQLMSRLYGLVDSWQNGSIDQPSFERELGKISAEPTLRNSNIDVWPMVQKILSISKTDR